MRATYTRSLPDTMATDALAKGKRLTDSTAACGAPDRLAADTPRSASAPSSAAPPHPTLLRDLHEIGRDLVRSRDLLAQLTIRDIRIRYKQAVMGFGWAIFMPLLIVLAGCVLRLSMAQMSGHELNRAAIGGIMLKALPWAFFVGAIGFATASLTTNIALVSKVYFPREVLPLSAVLAQGFDTTVGSMAVMLALPFVGGRATWALLWVPLLALLVFAFTAGAALFLSCANLFFRDVKYIVQVLLTFGIFFTPVFFEPQMFGARGAELIMLNPLAPVLEGLRLSVTQGHQLSETLRSASGILLWTPWYLAYAALWAVGALIGSSVLFHRAEFVFAEYV